MYNIFYIVDILQHRTYLYVKFTHVSLCVHIYHVNLKDIFLEQNITQKYTSKCYVHWFFSTVKKHHILLYGIVPTYIK